MTVLWTFHSLINNDCLVNSHASILSWCCFVEWWWHGPCRDLFAAIAAVKQERMMTLDQTKTGTNHYTCPKIVVLGVCIRRAKVTTETKLVSQGCRSRENAWHWRFKWSPNHLLSNVTSLDLSFNLLFFTPHTKTLGITARKAITHPRHFA
jgi:hypothetical protein